MNHWKLFQIGPFSHCAPTYGIFLEQVSMAGIWESSSGQYQKPQHSQDVTVIAWTIHWSSCATEEKDWLDLSRASQVKPVLPVPYYLIIFCMLIMYQKQTNKQNAFHFLSAFLLLNKMSNQSFIINLYEEWYKNALNACAYSLLPAIPLFIQSASDLYFLFSSFLLNGVIKKNISLSLSSKLISCN